jgi:endonuclease YncB( thermonuclease family)
MTVRPAPNRRLALGGLLVIAAAALAGCSPRAPHPASGPSGAGAALEVQDGDSFTMRTDDGRRLRIRVSGIDAPERRQPWSDASRRHLGELLHGGRVRIEPIKQDPFGRTVARVLVADARDGTERDVGLEQVRAGLAWHFVRYASDQGAAEARRYARAEQEARQARLGLWADRAPEAPWAYRSRMRRDEVSRPEAAGERSPTPARAD